MCCSEVVPERLVDHTGYYSVGPNSWSAVGWANVGFLKCPAQRLEASRDRNRLRSKERVFVRGSRNEEYVLKMVEIWLFLVRLAVVTGEVAVTQGAGLEAIVEGPRLLMNSTQWNDAPTTPAQPLAFSVDCQTQGIAIPR
jgi:hypothetical protein